MKRMLMAGALALAAGSIGGQALAADLTPPPPPPPRAPATYVPAPAPVFSWTGIYLGINGGYGFGTTDWTPPPPASSFNANGFLVGGTVGGNYQMGSFVLGLEGDWDWSNLNGSASCGKPGAPPATCETKSDWLGTARGRAGWAWDRILFYGTGGAAFGDLQAGKGALPFASATEIGWTAGAGIEAAITPNWTAKVEYLYVDLGNLSCPAASCGGVDTVSLKENVVRAGVNYKFGW